MNIINQNFNDYIEYSNILKDAYMKKHNEILLLNDKLIEKDKENEELKKFFYSIDNKINNKNKIKNKENNLNNKIKTQKKIKNTIKKTMKNVRDKFKNI